MTARRIGAVVLAAGASRRLGRPKQLLRRHGTTLVRRTATAALDAGCRPVIVVLGAHADEVRAELRGLDVVVRPCVDASAGVSRSIRAGVQALLAAEPHPEAVVLMACDQPHLDAAVLRRLCSAFDGVRGRRVACAYAGTVGTPALFERSLFDELNGLTGDRGAKRLLESDPERTVRLDWPPGAEDVDAASDWADFADD